MRKLGFIFLIILLSGTIAFAQNKTKEFDFNIKGVKTGTLKSVAMQKLGKPTSIKKDGTFPCNDFEPVWRIHYSGLIVTLLDNEKTKKYFVAGMKVTSSDWIVAPGVKISMTKNEVRSKLGKGHHHKESGVDYLSYPMKEGEAEFLFRNDKLVEINWQFNIC